MKMDYRRDLQHNYLVAETEDDTDTYIIRMITENQIPGLLSCECRRMDQKKLYYYDITSRYSLAEKCRYKKIKGMEVLLLVQGLLQTLIVSEEYLIPAKQICLDWNYIYLDPADSQPFFCCLPSEEKEPEQGMKELLEELLPQLDHQENEGVSVVYELYQYAIQDSFSIMELQSVLDRRMLELQTISPKDQSDTKGKEGDKKINPEIAHESGGEENRHIHRTEENNRKTRKQEESASQERKRDEQYWMDKRNHERALEDFFSAEDDEMSTGKGRFPTWILLVVLCGLLYGLTGYGVLAYVPEYLGAWGAAGVIVVLSVLIWQIVIKRKQREDSQIEEQFAFYQNKQERNEEAALSEIQDWGCEEEEYEYEQEENMKVQSWDKRISQEQDNYTQMLITGRKQEHLILTEVYPVAGRQFSVEGNHPVIVGQLKEQADLVLPSSAVSRIHASIEKRAGNWYLKDLNSKNGTWVNEQELYGEEEQELSEGDQIRFADLLYRVQI